MSLLTAHDPVCSVPRGGIVELVITPGTRDLGDFDVRRVLPSPERKTVGPFIFFDQMGPAAFTPGKGINVRPHPHIGLATVTYLFQGRVLHRDSLGFVQTIDPGAVNLMTAGRGIVHSERTPSELERSGQRLHGIQTWMALPADRQEMEPAFVHYPATTLPRLQHDGVETTVIIGEAYGSRSPVEVEAETLYLEQRLDDGASIDLPERVQERGIYLLEGRLRIGDCMLEPGTMAILGAGHARISADGDCHLVVVGGEPFGERHIWWNFVHTDSDRIEQAKRDWAEGRFAVVPGDDEFIPLPAD